VDLLTLRTQIFGSPRVQGIARAIQGTSEEELLVQHGALYPVPQRLEVRRWISAKRGSSSKNRKARFYSLTSTGRKQLVKEIIAGSGCPSAIGRILGSEETDR
jgi:PadR family transcriptional regulator, regulatory protein PadR